MSKIDAIKVLEELHTIIVTSYCMADDEEEITNRLGKMQEIIEEIIERV